MNAKEFRAAVFGRRGTSPLVHHGSAGPVLALGFTNLLLNVVTLFFWRFWGKTRVRRHLWANTTAWGEPLEYTGSGRELFLGFLVVLVAVFLPLSAGFSLANVLIQGHSPAGPLLMLALQATVAFLAGAGLYRARRYQLSRTVWRGIRGGLEGSAVKYGLLVLGAAFGTGLTLGWLWPQAQMNLARYRMRNTTFGDNPFDCDARSGPLYKRFAVLWGAAFLVWCGVVATFAAHAEAAAPLAVLAGALVLAPVWAWYKAAFYRILAAGTSFGAVRFEADIRTWPLLRLALGNILLMLATLGIGRPLAMSRTLRFTCARLKVDGEPDFSAIRQSPLARPRLGEGLAAGAGDF